MKKLFLALLGSFFLFFSLNAQAEPILDIQKINNGWEISIPLEAFKPRAAELTPEYESILKRKLQRFQERLNNGYTVYIIAVNNCGLKAKGATPLMMLRAEVVKHIIKKQTYLQPRADSVGCDERYLLDTQTTTNLINRRILIQALKN